MLGGLNPVMALWYPQEGPCPHPGCPEPWWVPTVPRARLSCHGDTVAVVAGEPLGCVPHISGSSWHSHRGQLMVPPHVPSVFHLC